MAKASPSTLFEWELGNLWPHNVPEELLNAVSTTLFGVRGLNVPVYIFSPTRDSRAYI